MFCVVTVNYFDLDMFEYKSVWYVNDDWQMYYAAIDKQNVIVIEIIRNYITVNVKYRIVAYFRNLGVL